MAGIIAAGIYRVATNLRQWVRPSTRGTGTLGHLVLWQTDSVGAAGVRSAHVHTFVAQSVTELGGRTVKVGETTDCSATQNWVCGISFELSRRTGAPRRVVLSDAHGLGSAGDGVTRRNTLPLTLAAHLLLPALGVRLTLVLGGEVAALPVLGVPAVAFKTVTEALMVAGPALGVLGTSEELTHRGAAEHAHLVRLADLVLAAARVIGAAGHGGQLALVRQRVPDGPGAALAVGPVVPHHALLGGAAAHHPARVHAAPLAADVDAAHVSRGTVRGGGAAQLSHTAAAQVTRVTGESVLADAGAVMVVRHAPGVGAALDIATRVHTPVLALHRLTDLIVAAVQVGGAGGALAASPHIIGVTLEPGETEAGSVLAHGIGAAPLGAAQIRH